MNSRFTIMLIIALLLAGGAAFIANRWVERQTRQKGDAGLETVPVVVAATKIPFGTRLEATQIKLLDWPKEHIPLESFKQIQPLVGKITRRSFVPNEILLEPQIREHLGGSILSALITPGMRAMSVSVNVAGSVAGFILPGNKVDIIVSRGNETRTLLRNMKILAIDQTASPDQEKPKVARTFTIEVTPKQAETIIQAMGSGGSLRFTLINPLDARDPISEPKEKKKKKIKQIDTEPPAVIIIPWTSVKEKKCKGEVC